jgi:hypothetical protein
MSTTRRTVQFLLILAAYMGLLLLLMVVQGILDITGLLTIRTSWLPFMLLHLLLLIAFFFAIFRAASDTGRQLRWLQEHGRPATARLLDMHWTGWRVKRRGGGSLTFGWPGGPRREYRLRLEISPPGDHPYEVTTHQYLYLNTLPKVGDTVPIKIHPQQPTLVLLDQPPPPS